MFSMWLKYNLNASPLQAGNLMDANRKKTLAVLTTLKETDETDKQQREENAGVTLIPFNEGVTSLQLFTPHPMY